VCSHFGYRVSSAWLFQHELPEKKLRVGGKTACELPELDQAVLSREEARRCATIFMAGIASEIVVDPSTIGRPQPWDKHPDSERRDSDVPSDNPSDLDMIRRYFTHARPPIKAEKELGEIARAFRSAHVVLAPKRQLITTIGDAIGLAHNRGESLSEERLRTLLGTESRQA
jgi:hypothetical protein